jgi:hypothetical protein
MTLTSTQGSTIKQVYEHDKEIEICELFNLQQITVNKGRKADAIGDIGAVSIKNARSSSTQVWLTTLNKFRSLFNIPNGAIDLFLGDKNKNRFNFNEIPSALVDELIKWMNDNKKDIIHRAIHGEDVISLVIFRDLNNNKVYTSTPDQIDSIVTTASWRVGKRQGSLQLVTPSGDVIFHLQREGKGRYPNNVLIHIHRKLFCQ